MLRPLLLAAALCAFAASAWARPLWQLTPEQLWPKAEVIVIGKVEDIEVTRETFDLRVEGKPIVPVRVMIARVRTLGVNKGELPFEFNLRFLTSNTEKPLPNGPNFVTVQPGGRYRLYLKKSGDHYRSILDGEYDDGSAIHPLAPDEPNNSLPTFDRDASPLARAEFRRLRPGSVIYASTPLYRPEKGWTYYFFCRPPLQYPTYAYEAEITITGARRFGPRSWVGKETPRPGSQLAETDIGGGTRLRLTVDGDLRNGAFYESQGLVTILTGEITKADKDTFTGTFSPYGTTELITLTIPRKKLLSVQRIFPADKIGSP